MTGAPSGSGIRRLALLAAVSVLLPATEAEEARGGFALPPDALHEPVAASEAPLLGLDPSGTATAVWVDASFAVDRVYARRVSAGGLQGPLLPLSPELEPSTQPKLSVGRDGRAFVTWHGDDGSAPFASGKGRWIDADGSLGPVLTVVQAADNVQAFHQETNVVVDPSGAATVLWRNEEIAGRLEARRVEAGGAMGPVIPDVSNGEGAFDVSAVALPDSSVLVAWRPLAGGLKIRVLEPNGNLGQIRDVGPIVGDPAGARLAVDGAGRSMIVFRNEFGGSYSIIGRLIAQDGVPANATLPVDPSAAGLPASDVAASASGGFVVGWSRSVASSVAFARLLDSAGVFAAAGQPLSAPGGHQVSVALLDGGPALVAWRRSVDPSGWVAEARELAPDGVTVGEVAALGATDSGFTMTEAAASGVAALAFRQPTPSGVRTMLARYLRPPTCAGATGTVVQGRPATVAGACTGPAIESYEVASQPAHGGVEAVGGSEFRYTPEPGYDGPDSFAYRATNDGGSSAAATVSFDVGRDSVRPRVTRLRLIRKRRAVRLGFSEPATAAVTLQRRVRRRGRRAAAARFKRVGRVRSRRLASSATIRLPRKLRGALSRGGRYRLVAVAVDAAGNRSKVKRRAVRVKRP